MQRLLFWCDDETESRLRILALIVICKVINCQRSVQKPKSKTSKMDRTSLFRLFNVTDDQRIVCTAQSHCIVHTVWNWFWAKGIFEFEFCTHSIFRSVFRFTLLENSFYTKIAYVRRKNQPIHFSDLKCSIEMENLCDETSLIFFFAAAAAALFRS